MTVLAILFGLCLIGVAAFLAVAGWNLRHPRSIGVALVAAAREGRRTNQSRARRVAADALAVGLVLAFASAGFLVIAVAS